MEKTRFVLSEQNSIANRFLAELRDSTVQQDRMRFRRNLERVGEILAYEISKSLTYQAQSVRTPLGEASIPSLKEYPVLITILRAGLPFHQGFLNIFDQADCGFIGAYRNERGREITINIDYVSLPSIEARPVVLIDPMLATGRSVLDAQKLLMTKGKPSSLYIASVVAAPEGLKLLRENMDFPYSLWTCSIDDKLNSSFYIVPGLGDAGDLSYGIKR